MSLTVKAYLEKKGEEAEIRRFPVPADASSNYDYLHKKISEVFPRLSAENFILFWKDDEGDLVRFSSDDELMSALSFRQGDVFKVFVHTVGEGIEQNTDQANAQVHPNITCDGCEGPVCGVRYKCYVCPDYDLCSRCESSGVHSEHEMLKIPSPKDTWMGFIPPPPHFGRWMKRFMRRWHNQHAQGGAGCPSGAPEEGKADEAKAGSGDQENKEAEDDVASQYLQDVGESVAAMLDPLGIDVAVDVETGGRRTRMRGEGRHGPWGPRPWVHGPYGGGPQGPPGPAGPSGPCGFGAWGPPGPWAFRGCGMRGGRGGQCKKGAGKGCGKKPQNKPATEIPITTEKGDNPTPTPAPPTEAMEAQPSSPPNLMDFVVDSNAQQTEAPREPSPDNEWTVVSPSMPIGQSMDTDGAAEETQPTAQPAPAQPQPRTQAPTPPLPKDPKIAKALQQMMEMGFSNEGGWLTHLVEMKQGDISQCLDAIKPHRVVESTGERRA